MKDTTFNCLLSALFFVLIATTNIGAQQKEENKPGPQQTAQQTAVTPNPNDVNSMDAIVAAVYDVISGPAGKKRDWNRMRSLFHPQARMIAVGKRPTGEVVTRVLTVEDYINLSGPRLESDGFFEREIARRVESFGHITHIFSAYEARRKADDAKPFVRGINSFQLLNDEKRWWVVTILWDAENPEQPIPEKYLKSQD